MREMAQPLPSAPQPLAIVQHPALCLSFLPLERTARPRLCVSEVGWA